jgi:hypothetical protein
MVRVLGLIPMAELQIRVIIGTSGARQVQDGSAALEVGLESFVPAEVGIYDDVC